MGKRQEKQQKLTLDLQGIVAKLKEKGYPALEDVKKPEFSLGAYLNAKIAPSLERKMRSRIAFAIMVQKISKSKLLDVTHDDIVRKLEIQVSPNQMFISQLLNRLSRDVDWETVKKLEETEWWKIVLLDVDDKTLPQIIQELKEVRQELEATKNTLQQREAKIAELRANLRGALDELEQKRKSEAELLRQNQELVNKLLAR
ncbi:MAG: hypothetical protein ACK4TA_10255 [Saprospiraceae bacterium]